jgi:hypothetical protein
MILSGILLCEGNDLEKLQCSLQRKEIVKFRKFMLDCKAVVHNHCVRLAVDQ